MGDAELGRRGAPRGPVAAKPRRRAATEVSRTRPSGAPASARSRASKVRSWRTLSGPPAPSRGASGATGTASVSIDGDGDAARPRARRAGGRRAPGGRRGGRSPRRRPRGAPAPAARAATRGEGGLGLDEDEVVVTPTLGGAAVRPAARAPARARRRRQAPSAERAASEPAAGAASGAAVRARRRVAAGRVGAAGAAAAAGRRRRAAEKPWRGVGSQPVMAAPGRVDGADAGDVVGGEVAQVGGVLVVHGPHGGVRVVRVGQAEEVPRLVGDDGEQVEVDVGVADGEVVVGGVELHVGVVDLAGVEVVGDRGERQRVGRALVGPHVVVVEDDVGVARRSGCTRAGRRRRRRPRSPGCGACRRRRTARSSSWAKAVVMICSVWAKVMPCFGGVLLHRELDAGRDGPGDGRCRSRRGSGGRRRRAVCGHRRVRMQLEVRQ